MNCSDSVSLERTYLILQVTEWIYNAFSLLSSIYFVNRVCRISLIHINLRIQLCLIALPFAVEFTTRIADHVNVAFDNKPQVVTNVLCVIIAVVNGASVFSCVVTILNIAMERLFATVLSEYESRGATIGIALLTITVLLGVFLSAISLGYDIHNGKYDVKTTKSCLSVRHHPEAIPFAWIIAFSCCACGTIIIVKLYYYNRRQRKHITGISLSTRYQFNENMVTTRALVPAIGGYILFVVPGCFLATYTAIRILSYGDKGILVKVLIQILYMMADSYEMFFIIYVSIKYPPLYALVRRDFRKGWSKIFGEKCAKMGEESCTTVTPYSKNHAETTNTYFSELDKCWNQVPIKKK
ncbi:serpentine type 7TM GPCR receptor class ab chemoreceptor domain-containing protein [Ditylenchus destructor]|uniref:Serpentine type 7TM GPCR receptor class ab chemoreceptor domain-containing protein n=1 Tax=Ditylenchus destructor TaxID=166010 RepID=A0AAD4MTI9_9BILA|nr:serpentine type 7TM GPCR receptor class ab chemoreceptor domain-containing protein [Ditylenchus destructor]